ncbi:hypothetical protein ACFPU1_06460 [Thalassorhabdus alkalitolerans]|uniref:Uncharacterized protein n=1 Tax=Thalassorhabdus alkalitolerans TaxID=2282697 RepID=A0ABW0YL06_9BACI|nr:hypothetical protein [Thalassobacillus sp. C254]
MKSSRLNRRVLALVVFLFFISGLGVLSSFQPNDTIELYNAADTG